MATYIVQLRAIQHLTKDLIVEADSEAEARTKVDEFRPHFGWVTWDRSEPEDIQIETITQRA